MEFIEKYLRSSIDEIKQLFKEKYYEISFRDTPLHEAVAKTTYTDNGFYFECAKMVLTLPQDVDDTLNRSDEIIEFYDIYNKIFFKLNQCKGFSLAFSFSGSTRAKGYIEGFTTNELQNNLNGYYRAIIIIDKPFTISSYFIDHKSLRVENTEYGSGIVTINVNGIALSLFDYEDEITNKSYFIIETEAKTDYNRFVEIIDDIILSITYLTGIFLGRNVFILGSADDKFRSNKILSHKCFYDDLKNGIATIPKRSFQRDYGLLDNFIKSELISKLTEEIFKNLIFKRSILLLCQANTEPYYVRASLYSVALETITNIIYELIQENNKPILDKKIAKSLRINLLNTLEQFRNQISEQAYQKFSNDLNRLNSLTNKQKLQLPFKYYEINLSQKDIDAIENRNDFLHGRIPEGIDKHVLPLIIARLLFCINALILKYIGFKGCILYPVSIYQQNNRIEIEEKPIRLI
ncbi:hypothetical protein [Chryseobacterium bernardetii]|uniref:hypothetical protein n=1 Tax=Chryseobacterium bernardetii TaxID=1241978 RepID=UPI0030178D39